MKMDQYFSLITKKSNEIEMSEHWFFPVWVLTPLQKINQAYSYSILHCRFGKNNQRFVLRQFDDFFKSVLSGACSSREANLMFDYYCFRELHNLEIFSCVIVGGVWACAVSAFQLCHQTKKFWFGIQKKTRKLLLHKYRGFET